MANYNTKQKQLIFEYLKNNKDRCLNVNDIKTHFDNINQKIGQTTIYRYLSNLEQNGNVVRYINDIDGSSSYQYIDKECHLHFHLKCINCNTLIHLNCLKLMDLEKHIINEHNFTIDSFKTIIYGLCSKCREKRLKDEKNI